MAETQIASADSVYVTRYMGSKHRLLDLIIPAINLVGPDHVPVVDLMAGTHAVGYGVRSNRKVIANDIQAYSEVFGRALLLNDRIEHVRDRYLADLGKLEIRSSSEGWFSNTYTNTYFSHRQCREIEEIRERISALDDEILSSIYLVVLAFSMGLCQSSPGHFAQFLPSTHTRVQTLREKSVFNVFMNRCDEIKFRTSGPLGRMFRREASELLELAELSDEAPAGSVVYFDPPYTSAQYSRYYHLLETIVLNDQPTVLHKAKYRDDRFQSSFCSSRKALPTFDLCFSRIAQKQWGLVLSYSSHGLVPIEDLIDMVASKFGNVNVSSRNYAHSMQGRGQVSDRTEFVVSARPK